MGNLLGGEVAYWSLDEGEATTVASSVGSYSGEIKTGTTWTGDVAPTDFDNPFALSFNGTSGWVDFGNVLNFGTGSFSVSLWLKASASLSTSPTGGRLVQKRGTGAQGSHPGWQLCVMRSGTNVLITNTIWEGGGTGWIIYDSTLGNRDADVFLIGQTEQWIHLGSVFDASAKRWRFYANGSLVKNYDVSGKSIGSVNNTRKLTFGASDISNTQFFAGLIDDVRLWDSIVPAEGFATLAAGGPFRRNLARFAAAHHGGHAGL